MFKENWLKNISYEKGRGEGEGKERKERKKYLIFNILLNNISHVLTIVQ
jgi:hypothetical protein